MPRKRPGKKQRLTEQQERFCLEMVRAPSAAQAAIRAGYAASAARQTAYNLLHGTGGRAPTAAIIRARVADLVQSLDNHKGVSQQKLESELEAVAFSDLRDVVSFDEDGMRVIASADLSPQAAAAMLEVKCEETVQSIKTKVLSGELHDLKPGETIDETTTVLHRRMGVKLHPKLQAIEVLARLRKFIRPSNPFGGDDGEGGQVIPVAVMLPPVRPA